MRFTRFCLKFINQSRNSAVCNVGSLRKKRPQCSVRMLVTISHIQLIFCFLISLNAIISLFCCCYCLNSLKGELHVDPLNVGALCPNDQYHLSLVFTIINATFSLCLPCRALLNLQTRFVHFGRMCSKCCF
jgi:hypothetical protein